jgi:hypothetical protein
VDRVFPNVASRHDIVSEVMATAKPTPATLINRITREHWHRVAGADGSRTQTVEPVGSEPHAVR